MEREWEELKEYVKQNLAVWGLTVASASPEDRLLPFFRGKQESIQVILEKMDQLDGTAPKKPGCCT